MQRTRNEPPVLFHAKLVAKIALSVGAIAGIGVLLAIFLITDDKGTDYAHIVLTYSLTEQSLGPAILVFGLVMVVLASISTWLFTLYGSFRIAGPLYRFSQNLNSIIKNTFAVPVAIRQADLLQREWKEFEASQAKLREHYACLREALNNCEQALQGTADIDAVSLTQALERLRGIERHAQL